MRRSALVTLATAGTALGLFMTPASALAYDGGLAAGGLSFQAAAVAAPEAPAAQAAPAVSVGKGSMDPLATFALSGERFHSDPEVLWPGFLSGLRGFEQFYDPIGQPIYFESPFINTSLRLLYLHHEFADGSQLQGGHLDVVAAQARVALTERLALIATKDGHSWLKADALPHEDGWNDIALGLKYAFYVDRDEDVVMTAGARWQWGNGDSKVLQGWAQEISPFVSIAKGVGKFHMIADATMRVPFDNDKGNTVFQWDGHFDYELFNGFAPCVELHGLHYLSNAERLPLSVGGLDYANIGSADVSGSTVVWAGVGARVKFTPNFSAGATYEHGLTNVNADIMKDRVTVDFTITW
jgi:hypothetical protein